MLTLVQDDDQTPDSNQPLEPFMADMIEHVHSDGHLYPSQPSPMSEADSGDANLPVLEPKQENKPHISTPEHFDVKTIIQNKMKELERKRKLERDATNEAAEAMKRPHR